MPAYYSDEAVTLFMGDCLDVIATLPDASIDACVTDPPYGIGFMGHEWDQPGKVGKRNGNITEFGRGHYGESASPSMVAGEYDRSLKAMREFQKWCESWSVEVLRVLKPGGYIVSCGAPRAYHRMTSGLEDAGFEIRDCLAWLFGSGFPKSLNLGDGLGTALKPAHEPIVLARKPFKGTVAANVAAHGTGALNIDACRIEGDERPLILSDRRSGMNGTYGDGLGGSRNAGDTVLGRWPANVCIDEIAALVIDEQSGDCKAGGSLNGTEPSRPAKNVYGDYNERREWDSYGDNGGASRFYYCAKPSRAERDTGTDGLQPRQRDDSRKAGNPGGDNPRNRGLQQRGNFHPTVKPIELMRWLVRLVTPPNGIVLDPFLGSGTTGMACRYEQRRFIGIEREADYIELAQRRIAAVAPLFSTVESGAPGDAVDPVNRDSASRPRAGDLFGDAA